MVVEVKFADFGEGLHEGEVVEWLVSEGDEVQPGDELVTIQTDKMADNVTAPVAGKIQKIMQSEGAEITVGDLLCVIESESAAPTKVAEAVAEEDPSLFKPSAPLKTKSFRKSAQPTKSQINTVVNEKVLAAPVVRRLAREAGIDLRYVQGSGPAGRIRKTDLEDYLSSSVKPVQTQVYTPGGYDVLPLKGTRKAIAKNMRKSKDTAAHYTYFEEVDMTAIDELRKVLKVEGEQRGVKVTYVAIMMKLLVPVLRKYPLINSKLVDDKQEIHLMHDINIGISVDTPEGLFVPVVKNVDKKDIYTIASEVMDLAQRAREGKLKPADLSGGTFSITSIGNIGGMMATPIIKHPEVAILGLMKAKLRPVVIEEDGKPEIAIRKMMYLSFSLDHRVVDGAVGARFIAELIRYMENPGLLYFER